MMEDECEGCEALRGELDMVKEMWLKDRVKLSTIAHKLRELLRAAEKDVLKDEDDV
jgi:hypothetical protein